MVLAADIGRIWWAVDNIIPGQDVFLFGCGPDERGWLPLHGNILLREAFISSFGGHEDERERCVSGGTGRYEGWDGM